MSRPDPASRPPLSRVPPHDTNVEANLLGAAMLNPAAAGIVAHLGAAVFYTPKHQTVAEAVAHLAAATKPTDPVSVEAEIRRRGQIELLNGGEWPGPSYLTHLQADCPNTTSAAHWADLVATFARRRHILHLAEATTQAVYSGQGHTQLVAQMAAAVADEAAATDSTWEPVNIAGILAGNTIDQTPTVGRRQDGAHLLYPGRIHAFNGEPEAAKSLCAQHISVQEIAAGNHVLYIDFEDNPGAVVQRLLELGAQPDHICERFHYLRPEEGVDAAARVRIEHALATWPVTLAVIDGVAEAMALSGWDENSNSDVATFYSRLPRLIAARGPATLLIDHVVKDSENQGRYARGAGHKLAGVDGAVFKVEAVKPFGRGMEGSSRLVLQKDRPARLREICAGGRTAAEFHVKSTSDGIMTAELRTISGGKSDPTWRPTALMERVSRACEEYPQGLSKRVLRTMVKGDNNYIDLAIEMLVLDGYMTVARDTKPGKATIHTTTKPYREPDETQPEPDPETGDEWDDQPWKH